MNMLIIGNGFDLAHDRPTKYEHFLQFLELIRRTRRSHENEREFTASMNTEQLSDHVRNYILSAFQSRIPKMNAYADNKKPLIQEIYRCLDENVWYSYFQDIHSKNKMRGKDWIDFESEIRDIIKFFDNIFGDLYEPIPENLGRFDGYNDKIRSFLITFTQHNKHKSRGSDYKDTCDDFIEKTYQDLEKIIRCLEIYLDDCVGKMPITYYSPDIQEFEIDSVLSFNYTAIPTNIYPSLIQSQSMKTYPSLVQVHYIHGCAKTDRPMEENNMVLGVNEYWDRPKKDFCTNFNCYKKFVQRIIKETGIDYKKSLEQMRRKYDEIKEIYSRDHPSHTPPYPNHVYIFGHSLDITDGDILKEIIQTPGVDTTIFYRNKQQQANQIANLSKVLGQDELLKRTFSISPTIIFKQQRDMVKL